MKRIILLLIACTVFTGVCRAQEGFRLVGQAEGISTGKLHLVVSEGKQIDTLGTTSITNGTFEFSGRVDGTKVAHVTMEGQTGGILIILENTEIRVKINGPEVTVEGGEEQTLYNQFMGLNQIMVDAQTIFRQQADAAARQGKQMEIVGLRKRIEQVFKETNEKIEELMKANPDHFVAAYILFTSIRQLPLEIVKERYAWLGDGVRDNVYGRTVAGYLKALESVAIGAVAPDFMVKTVNGDTLSLHGVKAKLKLLDFWASWCGPCRQENTNLIGLYRKFQPSGLQIVSVSMDTDEGAWKKAIGEDGMIWNNGSDLRGQASPLLTLYFVTALPHTILLDEENRIIAKNLRGTELRKKISELLKKK